MSSAFIDDHFHIGGDEVRTAALQNGFIYSNALKKSLFSNAGV